METNKFYLKKLPKELQERILELIKETVKKTTIAKVTVQQYILYLQTKKSNSFKQFLQGAFVWEETKEGYKYWENIVEKYN